MSGYRYETPEPRYWLLALLLAWGVSVPLNVVLEAFVWPGNEVAVWVAGMLLGYGGWVGAWAIVRPWAPRRQRAKRVTL